MDNTPVYIVPKEHYFMMGDNRDNSGITRPGDVGFVPRENLVGRAEMLFFHRRPGLEDLGMAHDGSFWSIVRWD